MEPVAYRDQISPDEKNWGVIAHLSALVIFVGIPSFLGPLVVWIMKKEESPYVASHAREALNFHLSMFLYAFLVPVALIVIGVTTLGLGWLVAIPVLVVVVIYLSWQVVKGAIQASGGRLFRYPMTIRFVN